MGRWKRAIVNQIEKQCELLNEHSRCITALERQGDDLILAGAIRALIEVAGKGQVERVVKRLAADAAGDKRWREFQKEWRLR